MKRMLLLLSLIVFGSNAFAEQVDITNRVNRLFCWKDKIGIPEDSYSLARINGQLTMVLRYDESWLKDVHYPVGNIIFDTNTRNYVLYTTTGGYFYFNESSRKGGYFASQNAERGVPLFGCSVEVL